MKKKEVLGLISIIIIFLILFLIIIYTPIINKYRNNGKLIINEVMANNKNTIVDSYGNSSDYIEIYNGNDYDINLEGYYLSDDNFDTKKWSFPDIILKSKEYLLVYASGLDKKDKELHTNFKLNNKGEVVTLSDPNGKSLSKLYYLKTMEDTSYGYNGQEYIYYYEGTPNKENGNNYSKDKINSTKKESKLVINEYMTNNISAYKSIDGKCYGMIELYNGNDYDINLEGYYLSDKYDNPSKYVFPNVTIKAKDYLLIYASGLNKNDKEIHTNFSLNNEDNILILSDNKKNEISKTYIIELNSNVSSGLYNSEWHFYKESSLGKENLDNYVNEQNISKKLRINEVSVLPNEVIEIKNISDETVNLNSYYISDKSGKKTKLPNVNLKQNQFYLVYGSDYYSYSGSKLYTGFHINSSSEELYLYENNMVIDTYKVGKLKSGISSGIDSDNKRVFYKNLTLGNENSKTTYEGYALAPTFSIDGGYVSKNTKIKLTSDGEIYYTTDGTFPTKNSKKYTGEITINKNTVIKAIAYKDNLIESDIISRTFIVDRKHDIAYISISTNYNDLFGNSGLFTHYSADIEKKVSFEFYESDGSLGTSFIAGTKLTGMDSRKRPQKSMAIYLRKEYGLQEVTYPFFKEGKTITYSSFTLRNAGEDPYGIRIQDTVLTYALKNQMDIDMQDYRPVVVYLNGEYYGLYNMREKLNGDYVKSKYEIEEDNFDLIKYAYPTSGSMTNYNKLYNYIMSNDPSNNSVYQYLKTQIDVQELCNYLIVESYYGNTDLGNIRYWKANNGKWRWMLYDLDWSLHNQTLDIGYPVITKRIPAATYLYSTIDISRRLYRNKEFKDLYLSTLAKHLKTTFKPDRMNKIIDELKSEIANEMPYHIKRWPDMHSSMSNWESNIKGFKTKLSNRYYNVLNRLQSDFNLSYNEYYKYFGDIK